MTIKNLIHSMTQARYVRSLTSIVFFLGCIPSFASTYTFSAPHLTMRAGDPVPPLIFSIDRVSGKYSKLFAGEPSLSTDVTAGSRVGSYPIRIKQGNLRPLVSGDQFKFVDGSIDVIGADGIGAHIQNNVVYPPGFLAGPANHPALDVTNNQIGNLVGDCKTDNAQSFEKLLTQNGTRTRTTTNGGAFPLYLYFPPGCYATSQPLTIYGNSWTFWGSGPQRSYIRLIPNSEAFNTGHPTQFFSPQSVGGNSNFREYLYNLGFEIGVGNPDAIPITTVQNNSGAIRNVQVWADDSTCPYALNFNRAYPGPMLIKDVAIYGCAMAYSSGQSEYNITIEGFTTEAQTGTVLDNHFIKASIRHWLSDNQGLALHAYGSTSSNVTVMDSKLLNGNARTPAILVDKANSVFLSHVSSTGYSATEVDSGTGATMTRPGNIDQAWTGEAQTLFNRSSKADSLHIPARETPQSEDPPVAQWTKLSQSIASWPQEFTQARSSTVYASAGVYSAVGSTYIDVKDSINHLQFFQAKFTSSSPQIIFTVAGNSPTPLIIDGCLYESCQIRHTGRRTIVLRDTTLYSYTSQEGSGDLFVEDSGLNGGANGTLPLHFYPSQHIWARQLNLEQKVAAKLTCAGCTLWILGYKTEQSSPSMILSAGAQAEVFGFFFYQNTAPTADGSASIYLTDSSLFATGWTKVDVPGRGQPNWIVESQGGKTMAFSTHDVNTSQQLNAFFSFGNGKHAGEHK